MSPLVSILIPVYNRESIIADTVESAILQTYKNIEIIVVDNASTDKTWQITQALARKDNRVKVFRNETNIGPVRNWLRCVDEAKGLFSKILWSDDLIANDFIEKTLGMFTEEVGFVYTGTKIFNNCNPDMGELHYFLESTGIYESYEYIDRALEDNNVPVSPGCAIFRTDDIKKNLWLNIPNKVNSDFSIHAIGNDLLLLLLTAHQYKYFGHIAEPLSFFRAHSGSISISSSEGKLPLHYGLAKAYFVENYQPNRKTNLVAKLQLLLWKYNDSIKYNIHSVNDFFESRVSLNIYALGVLLFKRILRGFVGFLKRSSK